MPTNVDIKFKEAEEEYLKAKTKEEKLKALKKMLAFAPKHKGTEKLIAEIKIKIKKLKEELKRERKAKRGRKLNFKKEGFLVALVGYPNTGKSYFMNKYCNKNIKSTIIPFETTSLEIGTFYIDKAKVQVVEIPSIYEGFKEKFGMFLSILDVADLILLFGDKSCLEEVRKYVKDKPVIKFKDDYNYIANQIMEKGNLILVYTKKPRKKEVDGALLLKKGATVKDLAEEIHKELVNKFKFARIYRGKRVIKANLNFILQNKDIVEIHA